MSNNRTILWTELIAFDPTLPDCGAKKYCDKIGFVPEAISLFLWGCDFVHLHDGMETDRNFPPDIGAYLDIYFEGPKVPGMLWSKFKLKILISALKQHGIKVLFSIFPATLRSRFHHEWVEEHPEIQNLLVGELKRDPAAINPLKRFRDGTFYEDFLLKKVMEVITDYGFDGWHLCDGYNHPWYQLCQADFSNDMIEQSGIALPKEISTPDERAEYIWSKCRKEWIDFHVRRNTAYLKKIADTLHQAGKLVTCHTAWARDPVDSIYRYGIDYRQLDKIGFDAMVIECVGCSGTCGDHLFRAHYAVPFDNVVKATVLLTRACLPHTPLLYMNGVQDMTEGYSSLRHFPGFLEREIFTYSHLGIWENGKFSRCFQGREVCLSDSETADEWRWLSRRWEQSVEDTPVACDGAVLVWSTNSIDNELALFLNEHTASTAPILYRLLARNANITSIVNINDINHITANPLLAINPGLWTKEERDRLAEHTMTPVITAGIVVNPKHKDGKTCSTIQEPLNFFVEHKDKDIPQAEYDRILKNLPPQFFSVCHAESNSDAQYYQFAAFQLDNGKWRVLIGNSHWQYIYGELVTPIPIKDIVPVNDFRGRPFWIEPRPDGMSGSLIYLRVPPLGIAVVDVELENPQP